MPDHGGWRSDEASDYLKQVERSGFAWEFLRRNPDYRRDFETMNRLLQHGTRDDLETVLALVRRWGLGFPLRPAAPVQPGSGRLGHRSPTRSRCARHEPADERQQPSARRLSKRGPGSRS